MRLTAVLLEHPLGRTPATYALAALMSLDAARLRARVDASGNLNSLFEQDRSLWDQQHVAEGLTFLELSATGSELTEYHVEAAIASIHARALRTEDTNWKASFHFTTGYADSSFPDCRAQSRHRNRAEQGSRARAR
jgi:predicted RNA polymerase sigma factor